MIGFLSREITVLGFEMTIFALLFVLILLYPVAIMIWVGLGELMKESSIQSTGRHTGDYISYLKSPEWSDKRRAAIERAGGKCQVCNSSSSLQVHHRTYERIYSETPDDLIVLCERCHKSFHQDGRMPNQ